MIRAVRNKNLEGIFSRIYSFVIPYQENGGKQKPPWISKAF